MKKVVNDALRRALSEPSTPRPRYELPVHEAVLAPGLDLAGFNRLADELEDAAVMTPERRDPQ